MVFPFLQGLELEASEEQRYKPGAYPLLQNDYRQEKIIFELFSGALQENPVRAPGAITGGLLQDRGPYRRLFLENSFRGLYRKIL